LSASGSTRATDFDALYAEIHPPLLRYLDRLLGDRDAAEDVAQEAFVRLLRRPELRGDDARLWLFTVATNLVRDRGRTATRRQRLLAAWPLRPSTGPLPDEELERREAVETVRAALGRVPERDRQLLLMREEGFRYEEIARAVGVAPGSVGTLIARALKRFAEVYGPDEGDDDPSR
jgi:RNA polymerase sigma-70 factor, ECF subfamily